MLENAGEFSIRGMCRALEVGSSGYYVWVKHKKGPGSARAKANGELLEKIKAVHKQSREIYGSPKICEALKSERTKWQQGEEKKQPVNHKRVERLMRENGIRSKRVGRRRFKPQTTDSNHGLPVAANRLARDFTASAPDQKWATDISYIRTDEGWLYLAVFIDLYSRLVVGWAASSEMTVELIDRAFLMGQKRRGRAVNPLVHSDRGSQYASNAFRSKLAAWECLQSMSRKGNCWDNAVAESFFSVLKEEMVHHEHFRTRQEAKDKLFDYIEVFYNRQRIHSATGYVSPEQFEARLIKAAA
jgi:putative transposase